ncbi:MAG: ribosome recycling factor [Gammaproteobacteria bacterium]
MHDEIIKSAEQRMHKSIEALQGELSKLRMGRATPSLLEHITIDYYGSPTPISQAANITVLDPRTLMVAPWDKSLVPAIEKAIQTSDLGLNPAASSDGIRIPLPPLTEERRKELIRVVKAEVENAKVAMRNIRRDANTQAKDLLKAKEITEDDERRLQDQIQKITDKLIAEADKICAHKESELMEI